MKGWKILKETTSTEEIMMRKGELRQAWELVNTGRGENKSNQVINEFISPCG